jgi:NAD(P)-dependent dehydrogenase (short-subunit alcohol dehydrogenase family)
MGTGDDRRPLSGRMDMTHMQGRLDGKTAIVTGAGQGGGYGSAVAMAREGARVTLLGRTASKLEAVAAEIAGFGGESLVFAGDVTRTEDVSGVIEATVERFGRLDVLVNAAQSPELRLGPVLEADSEMVDALWRSGFVATLALMRAAHPHMRRAGGGSIINFGSGAQHSPMNYGAYASVKAAIHTISRAAAMEWGPDNIRVNVVLPFVKSPAADADFATKQDGALAASIRGIPLGRMGDPEADIGRVVAFLASDEAGYLTGNTLGLDGGRAFVR